MYIHQIPQSPLKNTPFPGLNLKVGKMNYSLGNLDPNWAKCFISGQNIARSGQFFFIHVQISMVAFSFFWPSWGPYWDGLKLCFKILNEFKLQVTQKENVIRWGMLFAKQWVSKHTLYEYKFWNLWPIPSPLRLNMITHFSRSRRVWCRASWRFQELTNTRYIGTTVSLITWSAKFNCWNVTLHFFWIMIKKKLSTKMHFFSASI